MDTVSAPGLIPELINNLTIALNTDNIINASNDVEAISTWLREYRESKNTLVAYRQCVERFYIWINYQSKKLSEINREDVQNYQDFLANPQPHSRWCGPKMPKTDPAWKPFVSGLSTSSINHQISILKNLYTYLVQSGYLTRNAFSLMKRRAKAKKPPIDRVLEKKAIHYVMEYLQQLPTETYNQEFDKIQAEWLVTLFFLTGMRISEVADSRMNHFVHRRDKWWLRVVGKGEKYGEIVVTQELMTAFIKYRNFHHLGDYPSFDEDYPTIISKRGDEKKGLSANRLHRIIKRIFAEAANYASSYDAAAAYSLTNASAHWLRHASATAQIAAGISLESVKDNLRHESVETTMRYVHKNQDERHAETSNKFKI